MQTRSHGTSQLERRPGPRVRTFTYAQPQIGGSVDLFKTILKGRAEKREFVYWLSGSSSTALLNRIANTNDLVTTQVFPLFTKREVFLKRVSVKPFITHYPSGVGAYTYNTTALRASGALLEDKLLLKKLQEHSTDQYLYCINSDIDEVGTGGAWWLDASFMQKAVNQTPTGTFLVQDVKNETKLLYPFNTSDPKWYDGVQKNIIRDDEGLSTFNMAGDKEVTLATAIVGPIVSGVAAMTITVTALIV
jgi:hypothetical protein